jgi:hypothetical protein
LEEQYAPAELLELIVSRGLFPGGGVYNLKNCEGFLW